MIKSLGLMLLLSMGAFSWVPEIEGFQALSVESLNCRIEGHETWKMMKYNPGSGEMAFYDANNKDLSDHWDAFYFYKDKKTNRVWIVYHDGGYPDEVAGDAYIDEDMSGKLLTTDSMGTRLTDCEMSSQIYADIS
ncbi:MAG: hypothetical protein KC505_01450 [Myxococcales bacterium]|nr:hypothetical protein [Myxococcales bacterium]USN49935.1 MAG: hypothetical protein H6731_06545 [Myxococcales bacterium]